MSWGGWRETTAERLVARVAPVWALGAGGFLVAWLIANATLPRSIPVGVVVEGIVQGGLLSFTALGLVLVYRAARFVNFSQAAMGGIAASLAELAMIGWGLPFVPSLLLGLITAGTVGLLVDAVVIRRLRNSPRLILTVATVGLLQVLSVGNAYVPHLSSHIGLNTTFNTPLTFTFSIGTVLFNGNDVAAIIVVPVVLALLWWFLERTSTGTTIRAVADSHERAALLGIPVRRISRVVWIAAAVLSGLGAIFTTTINHTPLGLPLTALDLMPALAAFVLAGFESFPGAVVWSMLIGVVETAVFWAYQDATYSYVVMFGLVIVGVAVQHRRPGRVDDTELGDFVAASTARPVPAPLARLPEVRTARLLGAGVAVALAVLVPLSLSASTLDLLTAIPIYGLVGASLVVLTGWAGQISLGQFAFAGVGAIVTSVFLVHAGVDLFVALLASALVCAAVACAIGIPALRLPGLTLAAVTLTFAVAMSGWLMNPAYFPFLNPAQVARPVLFGRFRLAVTSPVAFYELCLAMMVMGLLVVWNFRRTRAGRATLAVRDNARGASAYGIHPLRAKLFAFALAGALAGVAGGLYVLSVNGLSGGLSPDESITVFTMVVIGGLGSLSGAVIGATYVECVLHFVPTQVQGLATGAGLLVLIMFLPQGLGGLALQARNLLLSVVARRRGILLEPGPEEEAGSRFAPAGEADAGLDGRVDGAAERVGGTRNAAPGTMATLLRVDDADVEIGLTPILKGVDLAVSEGEIFALLGTNGAGKSTALRTVAGVLPPSRGRILFAGRDLTTLPIEQRVREGIVLVPGGRGVFPSLTVDENLQVAGWVARSRGEGHRLAPLEDRVRALFPPLAGRGRVRAGLLSGGEQQMLAIALALLCSPRLLMIDELSLGLAPQVVSELLEVVRGLVRDGVTVMIVEQSAKVAASVAPRAAFMERGRVRFDGPMSELLERPELLRSVFLGSNTALHSASRFAGEPERALAPATAEKKPALSLVSVSKRFEAVSVLSEVSLTVRPGEIVGIIGSNGAGKTTLFDICSGFLPPDWGRVELHGNDVTALPAASRARRGLGRVFQDARLFPSFTVAEAVAASLERRVPVPDPFLALWWTTAVKDSEVQVSAWVDELLTEMGLDPYRDHLVSELSTGTRRLVELTCVVGHEPDVLLLDEPTSGLAQRESEALAPRLRRLREQTGAAFVVIEHDVPLVASIADRLVCMHLGRVIAEGTPSAVLEDPLVVASYLGMERAGKR